MTFQHFLEYLSPLLGLIGTILIFMYGVPRQIDTGGHGYLLLEGEDKNEIQKIKKYKRLGYAGLIFIGISFLLSFIIPFLDNPPEMPCSSITILN